ncbi:MAG: hypothetical protein M1821_005966 [Bathelium mastoideum]|nr:MAG: hypothetical protein M1821_005966 [Bathelium mastoideum]
MEHQSHSSQEVNLEPKVQIAAEEYPLAPVRSERTTSEKRKSNPNPVTEQEPFHDEDQNAKQYRTMKWGHAAFPEIISLGILSLPAGIATLGYVRGLLCQVIVGLLGTYTGYLIWKFKMQHSTIQSFADAGRIIGGCYLEWILMFAGYLNLVFIAAAHILTFKTAMTHITHTTCISITVAIIVVTVALALHPTSSIPDPTPTALDLPHAFRAVLNMVTSFCGHVAFVGFISELRQPSTFPKALAVTEITTITYYCLIAALVYHFAGPVVTSPAINSAPSRWRLAAWCVAMPTIVVAGVINMHVATKQAYVRYWRGTTVVNERSIRSYASWLAMLAAGWTLAWVLAEAIPDFHNFLAFLSALFNGWFMLTIPAIFWFYMHRGTYFKNWKTAVMLAVNFCIFVIGIIVFTLGMYASGIALTHGEGGKPFSCAISGGQTIEDLLSSYRNETTS